MTSDNRIDNRMADIDLRLWARQEIRNRKRARRLKYLNAVLIPISCIGSVWIAWVVWRAL